MPRLVYLRTSIALFVLLGTACSDTAWVPTAPLLPASGNAAIAKSKVAICHAGNQGMRFMEVPASTLERHMAHGDERAGPTREMSLDCVSNHPPEQYYRDDFNGPLDPARWTIVGNYSIQGGELVLDDPDAQITFQPAFVPPTNIALVVWEIGWVAGKQTGTFHRTADACTLTCNSDIREFLIGDQVSVHFGPPNPGLSDPAISTTVASGEHRLRAWLSLWHNHADYAVDGVGLGSITTTFGFQPIPGTLTFRSSGKVKLTFFKYYISQGNGGEGI